MANLKDTDVEGQISVSAAPTADHHVVRNNDARLSDARNPLAHNQALSTITGAGTAAAKNVPASGNAAAGEVVKGNDSRLADARTPLAHTHELDDITDAGTAAEKDFPASGNAATGEVVLGSDTRLDDARTPLSHVHDDATEDTAGFMSAADKTKLDELSGNLYWLPPVANVAALPLSTTGFAGDPLGAIRVTADTGLNWRHTSLTGDVTVQWTAPSTQSATTVYIGNSARLVAISGGVKLEVKNSSGTWVEQVEWTEA